MRIKLTKSPTGVDKTAGMGARRFTRAIERKHEAKGALVGGPTVATWWKVEERVWEAATCTQGAIWPHHGPASSFSRTPIPNKRWSCFFVTAAPPHRIAPHWRVLLQFTCRHLRLLSAKFAKPRWACRGRGATCENADEFKQKRRRCMRKPWRSVSADMVVFLAQHCTPRHELTLS